MADWVTMGGLIWASRGPSLGAGSLGLLRGDASALLCAINRPTISRVGTLVLSVEILPALNHPHRFISFRGFGNAPAGRLAKKTWWRLLNPPKWNRYSACTSPSEVSSSSSRRAASKADSPRFTEPPGKDQRDLARATRRILPSRQHMTVARFFMRSSPKPACFTPHSGINIAQR